MDLNPYEAPQTIQPRSEAMRWPWLLSWKAVGISGACLATACVIARFLTVVLNLHDPNNPALVVSAIANYLGIVLGTCVFIIGSAVWLIRRLLRAI